MRSEGVVVWPERTLTSDRTGGAKRNPAFSPVGPGGVDRLRGVAGGEAFPMSCSAALVCCLLADVSRRLVRIIYDITERRHFD